jgi:hypothetical protein
MTKRILQLCCLAALGIVLPIIAVACSQVRGDSHARADMKGPPDRCCDCGGPRGHMHPPPPPMMGFGGPMGGPMHGPMRGPVGGPGPHHPPPPGMEGGPGMGPPGGPMDGSPPRRGFAERGPGMGGRGPGMFGPPGGRGMGPGPATRPSLDEIFSRMDTNHDGMISKSEFTAFHEKMREQMRERRMGPGPTTRPRAMGDAPEPPGESI